MNVKLCCLTLAAWTIFGGSIVVAADTPAKDAKPPKVSYFREVWPIFVVQCQGCHQPNKREGNYDVTSFAAMLKGGISKEVAITPGKPDDSNLIDSITPDKGKAKMPKGKSPLTDREIATITRWIAEGAEDDTPASGKIVFDMEHPPVYQAAPVITSVSYSPDGQLLAVCGYHEVLLYKADGSELVGRLVGQAERLQAAVFSPDSKRLAVCGGSPCRFGEVQVWDVENRKELLSQMITYDTLYGASWSGDGTRIAFGCADNSVRAIDAKTGAQVLFQGAHSDWALGTTFSLDSSHLISVSRDRSMKLIEVATQRFVDNITSITPGALKGGLAAVDRHPKKDEVVVGGADGVPKIFRIYREAGKARKIGDDDNLIRAFEALPGRVYSVQYSPDGERIAAASSNDGAGEVRVYNVKDGKLVAKLAQPGGFFTVAFSRDGKTVAAAGYAGNVSLIDAQKGTLVKQFIPQPWAEAKVAGQ